MAGASANRRLIKKQYEDEHGSRDEQRLNFARSRIVTGLRHVGGMIITPGHLHTGQKILMANAKTLQIKCNWESISSCSGDAVQNKTYVCNSLTSSI